MAPSVSEGARTLIVGGGYIGLEAAAVCAKRGVSVTLVEMADRILQRVAAPETSDYFRTLHRSHGVDIREGDAQVRGAFIALDHATDRAAATRAVLEGVAFALRDSLAAMQATGTTLSQVIAVGGGARSDYWLRATATALDLPVAVPADGDFGAAFGAARLGMMAAGAGGPDMAKPPAIQRVIEPDAALTGAFADAYHRYTSAYSAIKELS